MRLGTGLSVPGVAVRQVPPINALALVTSMVIEGDSITYAGGSGNQGFAWQYAAAPPSGKTASVNAQNSRTVGGPINAGDGADDGTPTGNTLLLNRPADIASGANAVLTMIGTNDLQTFTVATYKQRLANWYSGLHGAGVKVGWSPPIALCTNQAYAGYTAFMAKRSALLVDCRNPAVWGQWADYYYPMGEQPDFSAADNTALINNTDGVHPTQAGQDLLYVYIKPVADTIFDASRIGSTTMYSARWVGSETNLATSTQITRRIIVSGLDPAGTALGASVSGAGAQISLNGATYGAACGTGSGDGYRLYNGDTIDLRLTTSSSNSTAVSTNLTIGSEVRTLTYTTVAMVTPVAYSHGGTQNLVGAGTTHTFTGLNFPTTGLGVLAFCSGGRVASGMTVGGVAATHQGAGLASGGGDALDIWTVPITSSGSKTVVITYAAFNNQTTLSWGVVTGADSTPTQVDYTAPANESQPHLTSTLTVPASGLALVFFDEYGGSGATSGSCNSGTTQVDELLGATNSGERVGIIVGKRSTSGTASFNFAFGTFSRGGLVFKAAGT